MWRLHVPSFRLPTSASTARQRKAEDILSEGYEKEIGSGAWTLEFPRSWREVQQGVAYWGWEAHDPRLWVETLWFGLINIGTAYVFLYKGFEWVQEPGNVQRFMW